MNDRVAVRTVHFARHGTHAEVGLVLSGRSDIGLSEAGRAEAARLARRLTPRPLSRIYSSPRRRALETAQAVADARALQVEVVDALDEIDFGDWSGSSFDALARDPRWDAWNQRRGSHCAPNGETMAQAVARSRAFVHTIADAETLCVSHCDVIRGLLVDFLGMNMDDLLRLDCDPGSLTTVVIGDGWSRVAGVNERPQ